MADVPAIFFSDMDGTFLTPTKEIGPVNRRALDAAAQAGALFVPCTGRALSGLPTELLTHPAVRFAVCSNGAAVYDVAAGTALTRTPLSRERLHALWALARGRDVTFDIFANGAISSWRPLLDRIGEFTRNEAETRFMRSLRTPYDCDPDEFIDTLDDAERVTYLWRDPRTRDALEADLAADPTLSVVSSLPFNFEVSDARATKGAALTWLCGHLGIPRARSWAFGDSGNDLSMLIAAGTGVAMANAEPEERAAADAVCASNEEDGVGRFILDVLRTL